MDFKNQKNKKQLINNEYKKLYPILSFKSLYPIIIKG